MKINQKSIEHLTCDEIFEEIGKRQVLALMFHDHMRDLYDFLNLSGFRCWHEHQYMSESKEFLNLKQYFMSVHNKLLYIDDPGQPIQPIPEEWYEHSRMEVTSQALVKQVEASFSTYKMWEESSKELYEQYAKALFDMGNVADAEEVKKLVCDVSEELKEIYQIMLQLQSVNYDPVYILDIQHKLHKKYKDK